MIGELRAATTVLFEPGSVYEVEVEVEVEVDASGASDRVEATGVAALQGGTVKVLAEEGDSGLRRGQLSFAAGGPDFRIEGVPLARDAALVDAGIHLPPAPGLGLTYSGNISDQGQTHGARAVLSASF